ncbi:hypothetical protein EDC04DRAFT_2611674 [Pisolithus marmoratus]|nr:hypothetical protein EDC04DRAFT_2611674 [Pisolithus marmoratus]
MRGTWLSDTYMPTEMKVILANPMSRGRLKTSLEGKCDSLVQGIKQGGNDLSTSCQVTMQLTCNSSTPGPHCNTQFPAQILGIFVLTMTEDVFAVIAPYVCLSSADAKYDPYPQFGTVAGQLYYDAVELPCVIHASNFLMLFAKAPFQLDYISKPVIHVLPLYKDIYCQYNPNDTFQEVEDDQQNGAYS